MNAYHKEFLGRAADPQDDGWVGLMQAGATEAQVATALISSSEYSLLHSSDTAFVQSLYQNVLGRTLSPADLNTAVNSLATQSRASLANFFVNSPESITRAIDSLYVSILATPVNPTLVTLWVNAYINGQLSSEAIASQIFGLPQYNARASGAVGSPAPLFALNRRVNRPAALPTLQETAPRQAFFVPEAGFRSRTEQASREELSTDDTDGHREGKPKTNQPQRPQRDAEKNEKKLNINSSLWPSAASAVNPSPFDFFSYLCPSVSSVDNSVFLFIISILLCDPLRLIIPHSMKKMERSPDQSQ